VLLKVLKENNYPFYVEAQNNTGFDRQTLEQKRMRLTLASFDGSRDNPRKFCHVAPSDFL
jgi:hypothetical protein